MIVQHKNEARSWLLLPNLQSSSAFRLSSTSHRYTGDGSFPRNKTWEATLTKRQFILCSPNVPRFRHFLYLDPEAQIAFASLSFSGCYIHCPKWHSPTALSPLSPLRPRGHQNSYPLNHTPLTMPGSTVPGATTPPIAWRLREVSTAPPFPMRTLEAYWLWCNVGLHESRRPLRLLRHIA